jgi:hypothetical protein
VFSSVSLPQISGTIAYNRQYVWFNVEPDRVCYTDFMDNEPHFEWLTQVRARGWGDALSTALDILEPFGTLGAQFLWIAQPAFGLFGAEAVVRGLAQVLEAPGGIEALRKALEEDL